MSALSVPFAKRLLSKYPKSHRHTICSAQLRTSLSDGLLDSMIKYADKLPHYAVMDDPKTAAPIITRILPVNVREIGKITSTAASWIEDWSLELADSPSAVSLQNAARSLRETNDPVAFPTETVYGLGADATRDDAVKAIYRVKGRPSDNPLIVHFACVKQIRELMGNNNGQDAIPQVYKPLIEKFWPGPLTILLPLPARNSLAPSVTVNLQTFGARIPRNPIALALLRLANVPIAAPSANASTKPSPTTAQHVAHDLSGRISIVLDGGSCDVGVESTVVDGLTSPPAILRPGGISIEQLRACEGWEHVTVAYTNHAIASVAPRAPGMKYRHYSPKAKVILFEHGQVPESADIERIEGGVGIIVTKNWNQNELFSAAVKETHDGYESSINGVADAITPTEEDHSPGFAALLPGVVGVPAARHLNLPVTSAGKTRSVWLIDLGSDTRSVAQGIFAALRELDMRQVDTILVEGVDEAEGELAAAIMNRLRKAAEFRVP